MFCLGQRIICPGQNDFVRAEGWGISTKEHKRSKLLVKHVIVWAPKKIDVTNYEFDHFV